MLRCPACRTRRATYASMQKHIQESGHKLCSCGGYPYKHRPGSPCCDQNPLAPFHDAVRRGVLREEEWFEFGVEFGGVPGEDEPPF